MRGIKTRTARLDVHLTARANNATSRALTPGPPKRMMFCETRKPPRSHTAASDSEPKPGPPYFSPSILQARQGSSEALHRVCGVHPRERAQHVHAHAQQRAHRLVRLGAAGQAGAGQAGPGQAGPGQAGAGRGRGQAGAGPYLHGAVPGRAGPGRGWALPAWGLGLGRRSGHVGRREHPQR